MTTMVNPTIVQQVYQGYGDGTQTGSTSKTGGANNTVFNNNVNQIFHLRFRIAQTDTAANQDLAHTYKLKFQKNATGGYVDVGAQASATAARMAASGSIADAENIATANFRLGAGTGTAIAGECEENNSSDTITFSSGAASYFEILFVLELPSTENVHGDFFDFRVYETDNTALNTYTVTPRVTAVNYVVDTTTNGEYDITGTAASLEHGFEIAAASDAYAISGADATLTIAEANKTLPADAGSYAVSGTAATLVHDYLLAAGADSYVASGTAATLLHDWLLAADSGSVTVSGTAATLLHDQLLAAAAEAYSISGTDAALTATSPKILIADGGDYAITGTAAALLHDYILTPDVDAYAVSGTAATLTRALKVSAGSESYVITGTAATLVWTRDLSFAVDSGEYVITGSDLELLGPPTPGTIIYLTAVQNRTSYLGGVYR